MVSEDASPASLVGVWSGLPPSRLPERAKVRPSLETCEEVKLGVEVGTTPRATAPRAPLLCSVQLHVRSLFFIF